MRLFASLTLVLVLAANSLAAENWYRVANVTAHDADTVKADVIFPWGVTLRGQSIRLHGADAWEISKARRTVNVTDAEVAKGKQALAEFNKLLAAGAFEVSPLTYEGTDSVYGRIEAKWRVVLGNGQIVDVAQWIKANGHQRK